MEDKVITISSCAANSFYTDDQSLMGATVSKYVITGVIIMGISILAVSLLTPVNMLSLFKEFIPFAVVSLLIWGTIAFTQKLLSNA